MLFRRSTLLVVPADKINRGSEDAEQMKRKEIVQVEAWWNDHLASS